jgi:hypothetical protein
MFHFVSLTVHAFVRIQCFAPPQAFAKYLRTLTNIAKFHSFDWLREVAESLAR